MRITSWGPAIRSWRWRASSSEAASRRPAIFRIIWADWHGSRALTCGVVVAALASFVTILSYKNLLPVPHDPDSVVYLQVARQLTHGHFVDPVRTPGYPLFIDLVFLFAGRNNLAALSAAQGVLFVLAVIGVYGLAYLILRRAWAALLIAAPIAVNVTLLSYVRPIMTEAQAIFLLVCFALALVWLVRANHPRVLWLAMGILFVLGMTRPEWLYFSLPFTGFALLVSWRRGAFRRMLPHALASLLLFSALCGLYLYGNARHGYVGFGENQNVDLVGKVMQYRMQDEAPPQYATITQEIDRALARGDVDPWHVVASDPALRGNHYSLAASYGRTIILQHPVEFIADTIPVVIVSLHASDLHLGTISNSFDSSVRIGPFAGLLSAFLAFTSAVQWTMLLFPLIAVGWWIRLLLLRRKDELTLIMAGLSLICGYILAITTLFVYTQYARMNAPYDALMLVVVWGTVIAVSASVARRFIHAQRTKHLPLAVDPAGTPGRSL